jgi:type VI secretion system secreted protein VgrG
MIMAESLTNVEYAVSFIDGPIADWHVLEFECSERVNDGVRLRVELATDVFDGELVEFLGSTCELIARRADRETYFYGVVERVDLRGHTDHRIRIAVEACSAFELGAQRRNSRIWQNTPTIDVIKAVLDELLGEYGRSYRVDASARGQGQRTYCVQYAETDFNFVRRLLEEEGISYYFVHEPGAGYELMVLADANDQYVSAENVDLGDNFPVIDGDASLAEVESLQGFVWSQRLTTTAVLRRDYDWKAPSDLLTSQADGADKRGLVRRVYTHNRRRFERDDLQERADDLAAAMAMDQNTAHGRSNALALRAGLRFTTYAHDGEGAPGEYIVLSIHHHGGAGGPAAVESDGVGEYSNEFECLDATKVIRPLPVTRKPRVYGPQTATVVGDQEIHTDAFGRIQVQFHWEESASFASDASCWVRCAQSWAGDGWGAQFIPRVGMEVVVEFLEGNPDRPLVTGCVYNGNNAPPFEVPGSSTQSGWRTNSSPGGGGSNELRFEDAAGSEQIYMHGQKDWCVEIDNDTARTTGNDETHSVGHDLAKSVGNNQSEEVGVDKTISVGSNHTETIGAAMSLTVGTDQTVTIGANQTISVGAAQSETIGATATQTVALAKTVTVGAAYALTVGAAMNVAVGAAASEEVGAVKSVSVGGSSSHTVGGSYSLSAASISEDAKGNVAINAGKELQGKGKTKVLLSSDGPFGAAAKTKFTVDAGDEFTVKCGSATISLKKNGTIVIKGAKITIDGSDKITMKGGKIEEN